MSRLPSAETSSGRSSLGSSKNSKEIFISEIPHTLREELCFHLDEENAWPDLANLMQLKPFEIRSLQQKQKNGQSASAEMLKIYGNVYNHKVKTLFIMLYRKNLRIAMQMLKPYVSHDLHVLIPNSRPAISDLLAPKTSNGQSEKLLNCSTLPSDSLESRDNNYTTSVESSSRESSLLNESSIKEYSASNLKVSYEELTEATNNWNETNILGKGGFGIVYKGIWKFTEVAIKQINYRGQNGCENIKVQIQQSLNELKYLNTFRHDNVLALFGYTLSGDKPCLVYQYMGGGCLDKRLYSKKFDPLTMKQRLEICFGTARGINYIHTHTPDKPLIHGDIKPPNILLDVCLTPKIGDFGLAREGPNGIKLAVEVTQIFGTKCYLPPEFLKSKKLSTQLDVYSFGVTLFETFTGQRAYLKTRQIPLLTDIISIYLSNPDRNFLALLDPTLNLQTAAEIQICREILDLGMLCTTNSPEQRPAMEDVLKALSNYR